MKTHWKAGAGCNRSALNFLPKAVRKAELIRPQVATFGKLQKADLDPSFSVIPLHALVGNHCQLGPANGHHTASLGRHFLTKLRGMKQPKSLAPISQPEATREILIVCSRVLTVTKSKQAGHVGCLEMWMEPLPGSYPIP